MAHLVLIKNPMRPALGREVSELRAGVRLTTMLRQRSLLKGRGKAEKRAGAYIVNVNGKVLMRKSWAYRVKKDDVIAVMYLPKGGNDGSNPLQVIAQIAVAILSIYVGGIPGMLIMVGGTLAISLIFPPPTMDMGSFGRDKASPTYTISQQGNTARLMEAIPVAYGLNLQYPDFASQPYTENVGNEQMLYQLFCLTQGRTNIKQINIEQTPVENYTDVQYQIVNPGQKLTLFPGNVITSEAVQQLEMKPSDDPAFAILGPFVVNRKADGPANFVGVDVHMPRGGFRTDNKGKQKPHSGSFVFEIQRLDENGNPVGGWERMEDRTITLNTPTPQMYSYKWDFSSNPGYFQVRAWRTSPTGDNKEIIQFMWTGMRGYLEDNSNYGDVTLLAMAIKATNQLNGNTPRKVNVLHHRLIPKWDPVEGWSAPQETSDPAWIYADILRNQTYGRKLFDSRINLRELYRLSNVWTQRNDQFNGIFDTTSQLWDACTKVLRAGRAMPMYYAGVLDVVRNEPKTLPTAMFTPDNMVTGSFQTTYEFSDGFSTPDYVVVEYIDKTTWKPATVDCVLPGQPATRAANVKLFGCTDRDQAWREGMSIAAANRDQRRRITFTTEMEGLIPRFGDLVYISHDVPMWGYSGTVEYYNPFNMNVIDPETNAVIATPGEMVLSQPVEFKDDGQYVISFRKRNGEPHGPFKAKPHPSGDPARIVVDEPEAVRKTIYVSDGNRSELTMYMFGHVERRGLRATAVSSSPNTKGQIDMVFANYADSIHSAENGGAVPPPGPESELPIPPNAPVIDRVTLEYTAIAGRQTIVASPANGATYYEFATSQDGHSWVNMGISPDPFMTVFLSPGYWYVRVRAFGKGMGAWTRWEGNVEASTLELPTIEAAQASTDLLWSIRLDWVFAPGSDFQTDYTEIRWSPNNVLGNSTPLINVPGPANYYLITGLENNREFFFWFRCVDKEGRIGPWFNGGQGIKGGSSNDAGKILGVIAGQINEDHLVAPLREKIDRIDLIDQDLTQVYTAITKETEERIEGDSALAREVERVEAVANGIGTLVQNESQARIDGDTGLARQITNLQVQTAADISAAVQTEANARVAGDQAQASYTSQVQANVNGLAGTVQANAQVVAGLQGSINSSYTIRVQANGPNGSMYAAGMSIGVTNRPGAPAQTTVAFLADRFAILNLANGLFTTPFVIQNGQVIIREALIGDATITSAKIGYAQIGTAHIQEGSITYGKIGVAQVGAAHIIDAHITNAKIAYAAVDTLKIANQSVVTGVGGSFSMNWGRDWGANSQSFSIYLPNGGFVQATVNYGHAGGINQTLRMAITCAGEYLLNNELLEGQYWSPYRSLVAVYGPYGPGTTVTLTMTGSRGNSGSNFYFMGRCLLLGLQR